MTVNYLLCFGTMTQMTKPSIWPTDKPHVVFMVPTENCLYYASLLTRLTKVVLKNLNWSDDAIDMTGLVASNAVEGTFGIQFMEETGIDTRSVTLLMLWGETADSVNFGDHVSEECGVGTVVLPATGVLIPTVRMPSLGSGWWADPLNQEYAVSVFEDMVRDGRAEINDEAPFVFVAPPATWN